MIWFKRLLPIVLLVVLGFGYRYWQQQREERAEGRNERYALLTARIWTAAAEYHDEPEAFLSWRDSVLALEGMSAEEMQGFLNRYEQKPEQYLRFTRLVDFYVDSLIAAEEGTEPPSRDSVMAQE